MRALGGLPVDLVVEMDAGERHAVNSATTVNSTPIGGSSTS
jgi:hypothetical protein